MIVTQMQQRTSTPFAAAAAAARLLAARVSDERARRAPRRRSLRCAKLHTKELILKKSFKLEYALEPLYGSTALR